MARVTPKTNWAASDTPVAPDFNRIEGNAQQAFDEIDTEANTRASADNTLQSNINAEASARASADSTLQSNINTKATKAIIGDNGDVGSVISLTSSVFGTSPSYIHTWSMPRSAIWYRVGSIIFSGNTLIQTLGTPGQLTSQFWQIG